MEHSQSVVAGQAIYSKNVLMIYDLWVLGFSNSLVWRCPTKLLREEFIQHASTNHLDVGVGTGYYPDKCFKQTERRLALLDLNANSLETAASRLRRFTPEIYRSNILEPLSLHCDKFDSISLNYLLHCLPGTINEKSKTFKHLLPYINTNGTIFGSTILGIGVKNNFMAKKLMSIYNKKGIFGNSQDSIEELSFSLNEYFKQVKIKVNGCVAMFSAKTQ